MPLHWALAVDGKSQYNVESSWTVMELGVSVMHKEWTDGLG
jgi:hypothetical protein